MLKLISEKTKDSKMKMMIQNRAIFTPGDNQTLKQYMLTIA